MDEIWEKAIKTALDGETDSESVRNLTLDGAVKCFQVRFPPPCLLQKFCNLEHLSIANAGVWSLENFPNLPRLQKLVLSDNRIAGGLDYLVKARLGNLRDLDLSNNRIQFINDLVPLAELKIMSLDLYECPVTKVVDYRGQVFGLVRSVKYLDKMDENQNERLESDDDEEEEVEMLSKMSSWGNVVDVDVDEDEESDADEEESEMVKGGNSANEEGLDDDVEEIDEEDSEDEEVFEVHKVHEIDDSDDEEEDSDDSDDDEDDELEEVDDEEDVQPVSTGRLTSGEGEIDGHDNGEEDENGEIGEEEEMSSEENDDLEDEDGTEFLVQPAGQHEEYVEGSDFDAGEEDDYSAEEDEVDDEGVFNVERQSQLSTSPQLKRKRDGDDAVEDGDDDEKVENGDLKSHLSTSAQLKKKSNGAVDDAKDKGGQKSMDAGKVEKAPVKL